MVDMQSGNEKPDTSSEGGAVDISYTPSPFSFWNKMARTLWGTVWALFFRPSPRIFHAWRRFLLKLFGAKLGKNVHLYPTCRITMPWALEMGDYSCFGDGVICYNIGGVKIGANTTVSQYTHLCSSSHDYTRSNMPQTFGRIVVEDQVWVCADCFIGPGVTVGQGAVVGSMAAVFKDVEAWSVVGGNPAKFIKRRQMQE
jgi:putative colanic acid biosynthesis acetyltransferase WcaF